MPAMGARSSGEENPIFPKLIGLAKERKRSILDVSSGLKGLGFCMGVFNREGPSLAISEAEFYIHIKLVLIKLFT